MDAQGFIDSIDTRELYLSLIKFCKPEICATCIYYGIDDFGDVYCDKIKDYFYLSDIWRRCTVLKWKCYFYERVI